MADNKKSEPAHPVVIAEPPKDDSPIFKDIAYPGLSKLEYGAFLIAQGLCAKTDKPISSVVEEISDQSIQIAERILDKIKAKYEQPEINDPTTGEGPVSA